MSRSPLRKALIAGGVLGLGLLAVIFLILFQTGLLPVIFQQNPGPFDRPRLEAVVAEIRKAGLDPGSEHRFVLTDMSNPKSLRRLSDEEGSKSLMTEGWIWTQVSMQGNLKVVIATRCLGHFGAYGFVYSDSALEPQPMNIGGNWWRVDVPGPLFMVEPQMKIDDHWWKVLNNLD